MTCRKKKEFLISTESLASTRAWFMGHFMGVSSYHLVDDRWIDGLLWGGRQYLRFRGAKLGMRWVWTGRVWSTSILSRVREISSFRERGIKVFDLSQNILLGGQRFTLLVPVLIDACLVEVATGRWEGIWVDSCEVCGGLCHSVNCFITRDTAVARIPAENYLTWRRHALHE